MTDDRKPAPRAKFVYTTNWERFVPRIAATTPPPRTTFIPPQDPPERNEK